MLNRLNKAHKLLMIDMVIFAFVLLCCHNSAICNSDIQPKRQLPVLLYHSINNAPVGSAVLSVNVQSFDDQMNYLQKKGYTSLFVDDIDAYYQYEKPVMITFDDGYEDNFTYAYPILKKYNMKATIFVISNYINTKGYLSTAQIQEMSDIVSFQSHTANHVKLNQQTATEMEYELSESKNAIAKITNKPVYAISYPYGQYNSKTLELTPKYYKYGFTATEGYKNVNSNKYQINRRYVYRPDTIKLFISKLKQAEKLQINAYQ